MGRYSASFILSLFSVLVWWQSAQATDPAPNTKKDSKPASSSPSNSSSGAPTNSGAKQSNILDFDADVIEGERSGPSIMVQMDLQAPNLDTLVFQRKNFNDFHVIDMKRKPKYRGQ